MPLVTTSLIAFGTWLTTKLSEKGFDAVYGTLTEIDRKDKFYKIVRETADEIQGKYPQALGGSIWHFFQKEEVFSELMNLLFFDASVDPQIIGEQFDIQTLPSGFVPEFILTLKNKLSRSEEFSQILSNREIYLTCLGVSKEVRELVRVSTISMDELSQIKSLLENRFRQKFDQEYFRSIYLKNAENNLSQVATIGLGVDMDIKKGKRKKIQEIFVRPDFVISPSRVKGLAEDIYEDFLENENRLRYKYLFSIGKNLVILGNPGSGKSFLIKHIICSIINQKREEYVLSDIYEKLPFRVELRKYLAFKKDRGGNILIYLSDMLSSEYATGDVLEDTLKYIVSSSETLFLFDGLDEIFDAVDKNNIKNDIENFVRNFPKVTSITTSRIEGYEEAPFNVNDFVDLKIDKFSDDQIEEYLEKWYFVEEDDEGVREQEVNDFLSKKDGLSEELISNPLLLSLVVILYRNNLKLPESKLEIYKSCTSTLVDKWDSSKDLSINLDVEILKRKETVLADLAFWQYLELSNGTKIRITYDRAKNVVGKSLQNKLKIADEFTVDSLAEKFMTYALKRSIYFDNNFTHKTFLEYYTAYYIYTNIEKKHKREERDALISSYISNPFWHIVLELLLNQIDKDQADNEIVDDIFNQQISKSSTSLNFLLSVLPSLQNVSYEVKQRVFYDAILLLIHNPEEKASNAGYNDIDRPEFDKLSKFSFSKEYRDILISSFAKVRGTLSSWDDLRVFYILKMECFKDSSRRRDDIELFDSSEDRDNFIDISRNDERLFKYNIFLVEKPKEVDDWLKLTRQYVELFGINASYRHTRCVYASSAYVSIMGSALARVFESRSFSKFAESIEYLFESGFSFEELVAAALQLDQTYYYSSKNVTIEDVNDALARGLKLEAKIILTVHLIKMKRSKRGRKIDNYLWEDLTDPNMRSLLSTDVTIRGLLTAVAEAYDISDTIRKSVADRVNKIRLMIRDSRFN